MIKKQLLLILLIGLIAISAFSQSKKIVKNEDNEVYTSVEQSAEYPGGMIKFNSYFFKNLHYYPDTTIGLRTHLGLQFVVEKDGSLSKITILKSINPKTDSDAVRVLKASGKWNPGKMKGKAVRQQYVIPMIIELFEN